jgi:transposase
MIAAVRSDVSVNESVLYVAFELGKKQWKLAMTSGFGVAPMVRTVTGGAWEAVERALAAARQRFGVRADGPVVSCYEAGRDGFWIHRALVARGIANRVVDSSSIDVKRRRRRMKTDRIDAVKLVHMLVRACAGEADVWSELRVPTLLAEAARHVSRERTALTREQTRVVNQIRSWLATMGTALPRQRPEGWWTTVRDWAGAALPVALQQRLARAHARWQLLREQLVTLEEAQTAAVASAPPESAVRRLVQLKGVAATSASILVDEGLVWRAFRNRRQVGGLLGFAPLKYESGEMSRDQGISRAGNDRLQAVMVQLAWGWVHWQPHSALTQWYRARFGQGKRARKVGIVALARRLLIALWRWATAGIQPTGAVLKPA